MKTSGFVLLLALALLPLPARATVLLAVDLKTLVGESDAIFVGRATRQQSRYDATLRRIVTDTTFAVDENVDGAPSGGTLVVRSLGGTVDGVGEIVVGAPRFRVGQRAVLFTETRGKHRWVTGMKLGVFRVEQAAKGGEPRVRRDLGGVSLLERSADGSRQRVVPGERRSTAPEPLSDFVRRVRTLCQSCRKEPKSCRLR